MWLPLYTDLGLLVYGRFVAAVLHEPTNCCYSSCEATTVLSWTAVTAYARLLPAYDSCILGGGSTTADS